MASIKSKAVARRHPSTSRGCDRCDPRKLPGESPILRFRRPEPMPADRYATVSVGWPYPTEPAPARVSIRTEKASPAATAAGEADQEAAVLSADDGHAHAQTAADEQGPALATADVPESAEAAAAQAPEPAPLRLSTRGDRTASQVRIIQQVGTVIRHR